MDLKIQKECLLCSKKYTWNEVMITKLPENASFCMNCINKFKDDKEYNGEWIVCGYSPDITFYK